MTDMVFDPVRGTYLTWDLQVVNHSDSEVPSWLPVAREQGETIAQAWVRSRDPGDDAIADKTAQEALQTGQRRYTQTFRHYMADGSVRWMHEDVRIKELPPVTQKDSPLSERFRRWRLTGVVTDITERREAELAREAALRELEQSRENMRRVVERANCLLWQGEVCETLSSSYAHTFPLDPERGTYGAWNVEVLNEAEVLHWLPIDCKPNETLYDAWSRARDARDTWECDQRSRHALLSGNDRYTQNFRNRMADGSLRWMQEDVHVEALSSLSEESEDVNGVRHPLRRWRLTGVVTDITERKTAEEALWWRANRDGLTGISNRDWIRTQIESGLQDLRQYPLERHTPGALFLFDLDGFKYVNDSLGHDAGDRVLQIIAMRLENVLQKEIVRFGVHPVCARLGGDEFVVWVPQLRCSPSTCINISEEGARCAAACIAESLLQTISQPTRIENSSSETRELLMTGSVGIALFPGDGVDTETLLKNADTALYQSKEAGRGKYRFFNRERSQEVANRLRLETRLRQAVKNKALTVWYQPQIETDTEQVVGLEALLRWQDPELGMVSPNTFIPLAEEIGLIHDLGEYALRTACHQIARWRRQFLPTLRVCVNLSALQLVENGMSQVVLSALEEAGLPGEALELEITETALFRSGEQGAAHFIREVRAQGIRLAIDDFGTGYSSLSNLRSVPLDVVKIDRNFTSDLTGNVQTRSIVRAIIDLSHALGLTVTAEGVETPAQQATLALLQCDTIQGFLFSQPVSAQRMEELLRHLA
ncbi:MAG: hypothetical protein OHK0029_20210 [Armatimonadaceae bacterium]